MKWRILLFLMASGILLILAAFASRQTANSDFENAREIIVMRQIAHQILLKAGDTSSRVLPVDQISALEFQINFETDFSFMPDTLVSIISKVVAENRLSSNYIVNVVEDSSGKVIFGYAMLGAERNSIVPCLGRDQPVKKYRINIKFQEQEAAINNTLLYTGIGILALGMLLFLFKGKKQRSNKQSVKDSDIAGESTNEVQIGAYLFNELRQELMFKEERIELTAKEARLLGIFAAERNQVIDRKRLQKEVWEDEGVIVGRSLDMFISKLRKKLANDPMVRLVNIHGKGYRLEVEENN